MIWYYSPDGIQRHEVGEEALAALAREGGLTGDMLLWTEGQAGWRPAREVRPDLFGAGSVVSPPPPPPAAPTPATSQSTAAYTPAYYQPMNSPRPTDAGALTSLISGIVGLVGASTGFCCCFGFLVAPVAGLMAVIFGHMVYSKTEGHPEAENDRNKALIGLILGYITLLLTVGGIVWNMVFVGFAGMASALDGMKSGSFHP